MGLMSSTSTIINRHIFHANSPQHYHPASFIQVFLHQNKEIRRQPESSSSSTMGGGGSSPCASCKLLRRRCTKDCIFAPYFPPNEPHKFAIVHKVFGASNISKMLQELPVDRRGDAVSSLVYEANARVRDPVYGCVGAISYLQNQVSQLQMQLAVAQTEILCIQMQQGTEMGVGVGVAAQIESTDHEKSVLNHFNNINGVVGPQCLSFAASDSTTSHEVQDPRKRESLWT